MEKSACSLEHKEAVKLLDAFVIAIWNWHGDDSPIPVLDMDLNAVRVVHTKHWTGLEHGESKSSFATSQQIFNIAPSDVILKDCVASADTARLILISPNDTSYGHVSLKEVEKQDTPPEFRQARAGIWSTWTTFTWVCSNDPLLASPAFIRTW